MNKTKKLMAVVASVLVCAALITGSAFAISAATAGPMTTAPTVMEASAPEFHANDLNVVAIEAKSSENNSTEGKPVLVQNGTVTVSGQDNKIWKIGDEGLEFEGDYELPFTEEEGVVTVSGQDNLTWKIGEEGVVEAKRGFEAPFVEGIPGEDDITLETAVGTAIRAIQSKYALTDATLARFAPQALLNVANPDEPIWSVVFNPVNNCDFSEIGCYNVKINAKTGDIVSIISAADGIG